MVCKKVDFLSVKVKLEFANLHTNAANDSNSPIEYIFSVLCKYQLPYAIGFVFPSSCFCHSVNPSYCTNIVRYYIVYLLRKVPNTDLRSTFVFIFPKSSSCSTPHFHVSFFFNNFWSRSVLFESFG